MFWDRRGDFPLSKRCAFSRDWVPRDHAATELEARVCPVGFDDLRWMLGLTQHLGDLGTWIALVGWTGAWEKHDVAGSQGPKRSSAK